MLITFILTSTALYSHTFKEASSNIQMQDVVYLLIICFWISLTIFYVAKKSHHTSRHTTLSLCFSLFFIYAFMPQIETLLLGNVYASLSVVDVLFIIIGNAVPVIVTVLVGVKLFGNDFHPSRYSREPKKFTVIEVIVKLVLTGFFYVLIYFVFGYFVYWRMGASHVFYNGDNHNTGFIPKIMETWNDVPQVYLIEFIRGLLYGIFVLPVINIFRKRSLPLLISLVLLLATPVLYMLVPDSLFPNTVRVGHLWQIAGTQFLFALITWLVFDKIKIYKQ
ncbi:hypothetical protein FACS189437_00250 [Bacteroidia bacterium]|nr:hypothetical protein FACS189437_00250 [Bacteroidia bacterium]